MDPSRGTDEDRLKVHGTMDDVLGALFRQADAKAKVSSRRSSKKIRPKKKDAPKKRKRS